MLGTVGVSWSDTWMWGMASTVSFTDWEASSSTPGNNMAVFNFDAFGGTTVTAAVVAEFQLETPPNATQIVPAAHRCLHSRRTTASPQRPAAVRDGQSVGTACRSARSVGAATDGTTRGATISSGEALNLKANQLFLFWARLHQRCPGYPGISIDLNFGRRVFSLQPRALEPQFPGANREGSELRVPVRSP